MRIALFGGTFDPPHRGHVAIARAAAERFGLDKVLFAPTGVQPLKRDTATPFATRLALVEAACEGDPRFVASAIDAPRLDHTPNYTVDTLAALAAAYPGDTLFNLVGADSMLNLRHWREPDRLLELAEWIVVTRPGYALTEADVKQVVPKAEQRARIHILDGVAEDVSATELRERLHRGEACFDLLPEGVALSIEAQRLYR
jgi:nicotinate-nucleotide adenylyltransferase